MAMDTLRFGYITYITPQKICVVDIDKMSRERDISHKVNALLAGIPKMGGVSISKKDFVKEHKNLLVRQGCILEVLGLNGWVIRYAILNKPTLQKTIQYCSA